MGFMRYLLLLSLGLTLTYSLEAPENCNELDTPPAEVASLMFNHTNRSENINRFCQEQAYRIRREHFWCLGYIDATNNTEVEGSTNVRLPEDSNDFWTIFLQYPALSWMDVGRKALIMRIIGEIVELGDCNFPAGFNYSQFCVSNVETDDVSEYTESVLITVYNLGGMTGDVFNMCFNRGLGQAGDLVVEFRDQRAFRLTLAGMDLLDMFERNIGPASSIGDEDEDPTLRPVLLNSWGGKISLSDARDSVSDSDYATNPNPINYGLEPGDIVFSFFGAVLVFAALVLIALGFCIHPFFFS